MAAALRRQRLSDGQAKSYPERNLLKDREQAVRQSMMHAGAGLGCGRGAGCRSLVGGKKGSLNSNPAQPLLSETSTLLEDGAKSSHNGVSRDAVHQMRSQRIEVR